MSSLLQALTPLRNGQLTKRPARIVRHSVIAVLLLAGCSATEPTQPYGEAPVEIISGKDLLSGVLEAGTVFDKGAALRRDDLWYVSVTHARHGLLGYTSGLIYPDCLVFGTRPAEDIEVSNVFPWDNDTTRTVSSLPLLSAVSTEVLGPRTVRDARDDELNTECFLLGCHVGTPCAMTVAAYNAGDL